MSFSVMDICCYKISLAGALRMCSDLSPVSLQKSKLSNGKIKSEHRKVKSKEVEIG